MSRTGCAKMPATPFIIRHPDPSPSWIICDRVTGCSILETYNPAVIAKLNTARYEAVPVKAYLSNFNRHATRTGA
jgi:hypothetical protein